MRRAGVLLCIAGLLFAACGTEETPEAAGPETIEVRAANYAFAAPATMPAGPVEIAMTNAGPEPHQAQLFKLNAGVTAKEVIAAAKTDAGVESLGTYAGGPNAVDAGESQTTVTTLAAGNYAFICLVPDPKGQLHAGLGMVKAVTVEANDDQPEAEAATYTAATKDFDFEFPDAWSGSIEVTNKGKEPHEFQVMEVAEGKTEQDFLEFFQTEGPPPAGPPPWTTGGGSAVIPAGSSDIFEADVKPGRYFLMCFVFSPAKKAPHFALGMLKKFEVK